MRRLLLVSTAVALVSGVARAQQLPNLLNGYATTPPWPVAGVNYAVGVPAGTTLADPSTISMPGVSVNASNQTVTVTGSNVTLSGYNFSNWGVAIAPGAANTTITNSSFLVGSNNTVPINAAPGSGNLTVTNSSLDGGSTTNPAVWALISYGGSGTFTAGNDAFQNAPEDAIDFNGATMTANVQNNLFQNLGTSPGAHPDTVQFMGGTSNNSVISGNTVFQPNPSGEQGIQLQAQGGAVLNNTAIEDNVIVAKGATGQDMSYGIAVIQTDGTINGATVSGNYIDSSGSWGPFYPPSGSNLDFGGNVNLSTGQTIAAPRGTSSAVPASVAVPSSVPAANPTTKVTGATAQASSAAPAASSSPASTAAPSTPPVVVCGIVTRPLLGAEIGDPPSANGQANYASFVSAMGQAPAVIDTYLELDPSQFASSAAYSASTVKAANPNAIPAVGVPMGNGASDFQAIAAGQWDSDLTAAFRAFASAGDKTIIIRPGWEMNGGWEPWSVNPGNAADFVAAFQHIANLAHSFSGMNIQVSWNPGAVTSTTSYMSIFPGARYVDSIGIDTYGAAGGTPDTMPLQTSTDPNTFTLQDAIKLALANGKPLALPETGAGPGDTAFPQNLASVITTSGVPVSFVSVWDDQSGGYNGASLHWSDNAASNAAWKAAFSAILADNTGEVCDPAGSITSGPPAAASGDQTTTQNAATANSSTGAEQNQAQTPAVVSPAPVAVPPAVALAAQPETAPPLAPASTAQTAPALAPASPDQTAPALVPNAMSIDQVAAMATGAQ